MFREQGVHTGAWDLHLVGSAYYDLTFECTSMDQQKLLGGVWWLDYELRTAFRVQL